MPDSSAFIHPAIGHRRVVIAMTRMDMPNGTRIALSGRRAANSEGYSGLPAAIDNHYFSMFGSSLLVGASLLLLQKEDRSTTSTLTPNGTQNSGAVLANSLSSVVPTLAERRRSSSLEKRALIPVRSGYAPQVCFVRRAIQSHRRQQAIGSAAKMAATRNSPCANLKNGVSNSFKSFFDAFEAFDDFV